MTGERDIPAVPDLLDRVVQRAFRAGLPLSSALSTGRLDASTIALINEARRQLDLLVSTILSAGFDDVARSATLAREMPPVPPRARRLSRLGGHSLFAYSHGRYDFIRVQDATLWAHESEGVLLSAHGGRPLARRDGRVFYDIETDIPAYYEDPPPASGAMVRP